MTKQIVKFFKMILFFLKRFIPDESLLIDPCFRVVEFLEVVVVVVDLLELL